MEMSSKCGRAFRIHVKELWRYVESSGHWFVSWKTKIVGIRADELARLLASEFSISEDLARKIIANYGRIHHYYLEYKRGAYVPREGRKLIEIGAQALEYLSSRTKVKVVEECDDSDYWRSLDLDD